MNKTAVKNRKKIQDALFALMKKQPVEAIRITEICDAAGISRTAFYHHYSGIDEVLISAYEDAHERAFGSHEWNTEYLRSDIFIQDMIRFFDENSDLIYALRYWNLLGTVAGAPTRKSIESASDTSDSILQAYPQYAMIYFWSSYFTICMAWLRNGKKESRRQLFQIISHLRKI